MAVEYALGASLLVVALIGSIEALGESSADELRDRGSAIGAPDLDATGDPAPPPPPPPDPTDPDPPPLPETVVSLSLAGDARNAPGNEWSVSVTVTALDDALRPRESVQVQATWSSTSPSLSPQSTQCTTNLNGTCTMTIRNLSRSAVLDVILTVTAVSGPGVTAAALPAPIVVTP